MTQEPGVDLLERSLAGTRFVRYLRIPPDLARVADVRTFIDEAGVHQVLSPERTFDLKVAASEACANAIEHAKSDVRTLLWQFPDRVVIEISNVGPFVPRNREADTGKNQSRGLGLGLMVSLADEIRMSTKRRGRTTIWLTFDRDAYQEARGLEE